MVFDCGPVSNSVLTLVDLGFQNYVKAWGGADLPYQDNCYFNYKYHLFYRSSLPAVKCHYIFCPRHLFMFTASERIYNVDKLVG